MWIVIFLVVAALVLGAFFALGGKNYVCIRRKDCCGMGCGCLFPKKIADPVEAAKRSSELGQTEGKL